MELVLNDSFLELSSVETELIDGGNIDWDGTGDAIAVGAGAIIGRAAGGAAGMAIGGPAGAKVGEAVGEIAGAAAGHMIYRAFD
ncbi:hypothetical protein [Butyrivibrio sp. AE2005]|uniref:hypothetical protein n=1 Tax=Butyrivibrio sp. AE2005 TaxID=1496722 RepID=UPI00068F9149|nr:hypothetical protein [Butyrivibrio sp. AE2005]